MKPFGIPIVYVVIAVGVLGVVVFSYFQFNAKAFAQDDTLKCQRTYDFSNVKFTPEAKADWEKCYMPEPLYERRGDGSVYCVYYPEESCDWCADAIAFKYNDSKYCELMRPCGISEGKINNCKKVVFGMYVPPLLEPSSVGNLSEITTRVDSIYPYRKKSKS